MTKNSIWEFSNPLKFKKLAGILIPIFGIIAFVCVIIGLSWGFFYTPDDYKQGPLVKIIYVHVPSSKRKQQLPSPTKTHVSAANFTAIFFQDK